MTDNAITLQNEDKKYLLMLDCPNNRERNERAELFPSLESAHNRKTLNSSSVSANLAW